MSTTSEVKKDCLWIVLFLIVFINGFEAGGYQASLWSVGKNYDLSVTSMGLFAAMELFATMLAPILLGRWADSVEKARSISLMLAIQFIAAVTILFTSADRLFLVCIFFLGLTTSALQFIAIAALADAYPVSGGKKNEREGLLQNTAPPDKRQNQAFALRPWRLSSRNAHT